MIWYDIIGLIGAFLLSIKFIPMVYQQYNDNKNEINFIFCIFEIGACIFLGISAIGIGSIPFIICNTISLLNIFILLFIYYYNKY